MSLQIKSLKQTVLATSGEGELYPVPSGKTAIVKGIRLVNTGTGSAVINIYVKRGTGTSYRILPKDLTLAPGAAFIDSDELTLEGLAGTDGDRIRGLANSGATVDCVISGVERDVT